MIICIIDWSTYFWIFVFFSTNIPKKYLLQLFIFCRLTNWLTNCYISTVLFSYHFDRSSASIHIFNPRQSDCRTSNQSINIWLMHYNANIYRSCGGVFDIFTSGSVMNFLISFFPTVRLLISMFMVKIRSSYFRASSSYRHISRVLWK